MVRGAQPATPDMFARLNVPAALQASFAGITQTTQHVYPDNIRAVRLFEQRLQTQWRVAIGQAGALHLGLDYPGVEVVLRHCGIDEAERPALFRDVQVLESAWLNEHNRQQKAAMDARR